MRSSGSENPEMLQNYVHWYGFIKQIRKLVHKDHLRLSVFQHRIEVSRIKEHLARKSPVIDETIEASVIVQLWI